MVCLVIAGIFQDANHIAVVNRIKFMDYTKRQQKAEHKDSNKSPASTIMVKFISFTCNTDLYYISKLVRAL